MKIDEITLRFTDKDGRGVILRTLRWEDLDNLTDQINSLVDEGAFIGREVYSSMLAMASAS